MEIDWEKIVLGFFSLLGGALTIKEIWKYLALRFRGGLSKETQLYTHYDILLTKQQIRIESLEKEVRELHINYAQTMRDLSASQMKSVQLESVNSQQRERIDLLEERINNLMGRLGDVNDEA